MMGRHWMICRVAIVAITSMAVSVCRADEQPPEATPIAQQLVESALQLELDGDNQYRDLTLKNALDRDPMFAPAHWHRGEVLADGEWHAVTDVMANRRADDRIQEYQRMRDLVGNDADAEAELALWCDQHGFDDRARLHWHRVAANPNADERDVRRAAKRLQLQQIGNMVLDDRQMDQLLEHQDRLERNFEKWQKQIEGWVKALSSSRTKKQAAALAELRAVRDPGAVLALEMLLSPLSAEAALEVIAVLEKIEGYEASESLVRHALGAPWPEVASAAAIALKFRPKHEYAPLLLQALKSPIHTSFRVVQQGQNVRYQRLAYTQGVDGNYLSAYSLGALAMTGSETFVDDSRVREILVPGESNRTLEQNISAHTTHVADNRQSGPAAERLRLQLKAFRDQRQLDRTNDGIKQDNARVFSVLATATSEVLPDEPAAWWDWWHEYNEVNQYVGPKPTYYDYRWYEYAYDATYKEYIQEEGYRKREVNGQLCSCFTADTVVWTETGVRPIVNVEPGDRVLSQDPETGELAFKVVIKRTYRPPEDILSLRVEGEPIECTKGHPFWVNGTGWRMAKLISAEDRVHTVGGAGTVDEIATQPYQDEAYNLVVDDFGTYFVGRVGALVHDNTYRKATTAVVPGL